eukprot:Gb_37232 [translate_table: standard]
MEMGLKVNLYGAQVWLVATVKPSRGSSWPIMGVSSPNLRSPTLKPVMSHPCCIGYCPTRKEVDCHDGVENPSETRSLGGKKTMEKAILNQNVVEEATTSVFAGYLCGCTGIMHDGLIVRGCGPMEMGLRVNLYGLEIWLVATVKPSRGSSWPTVEVSNPNLNSPNLKPIISHPCCIGTVALGTMLWPVEEATCFLGTHVVACSRSYQLSGDMCQGSKRSQTMINTKVRFVLERLRYEDAREHLIFCIYALYCRLTKLEQNQGKIMMNPKFGTLTLHQPTSVEIRPPARSKDACPQIGSQVRSKRYSLAD